MDSHDLYGTYALFGEQPVAIACPRLLLKGWIDVIQLADLPLRRVDWLLTSALRGAAGAAGLAGRSGLADRVRDHDASRAGPGWCPELDCSLRRRPGRAAGALRARIAAWQNLCGARPTLGWWLSVSRIGGRPAATDRPRSWREGSHRCLSLGCLGGGPRRTSVLSVPRNPCPQWHGRGHLPMKGDPASVKLDLLQGHRLAGLPPGPSRCSARSR